MLKRLRDAGPVLLVDAGNALFEFPGAADARGKGKAELILRTMGELKTAAMAAGQRDLVLGPEYLAQAAQRAGVPVLSANLTRGGKPIFPASTVVTVGGVKVGLVGLSPFLPSMDRFPGVRGEPPLPAALAEAKKLRGKGKVDLVVALAAVSYADALQLAKEGGALFDLILQSGDRRGLGLMQRQETSFVVGSGERGRAMGALALDLSGKGPLFDLAEIERARSRQRALESQVQEAQRRISELKDPARIQGFQRALDSFQAQIRKLREDDLEGKAKGAKTARLSVHHLDAAVADDPELKAQVVKLHPY